MEEGMGEEGGRINLRDSYQRNEELREPKAHNIKHRWHGTVHQRGKLPAGILCGYLHTK